MNPTVRAVITYAIENHERAAQSLRDSIESYDRSLAESHEQLDGHLKAIHDLKAALEAAGEEEADDNSELEG